MRVLAVSVEVNLGGDWSALQVLGGLVLLLYLLFAFFLSLDSIGTRMTKKLFPAMLGVVALIGIVLLSRFQESGDDTLRITAETDRLSVESSDSDAVDGGFAENETEGGGSDEDFFTHFHDHDS